MHEKTTVYNVDSWPVGNAREDIGNVINSIIDHIKSLQPNKDVGQGGKPGAVIRIPPGDFRLKTQIRIDISFLRIEGSGHGFTSSSIRFNLSESDLLATHELWPGGSRILVDIDSETFADKGPVAAIVVERQGSPRLSSLEFLDFCLDGIEFKADGSDSLPQNTYKNGKLGIQILTPNDSVKISGMGFVYLEKAIEINYADALSIHDNFVAECGSCIELLGWGQASKITDNLIGAGPNGHGIFAENHGGLLVTSNNIFPRGASSLTFSGVLRSNVSANRLHAFYPGMVRIIDGSSENLLSSNHLLKDNEPWLPFLGVSNTLNASDGLVIIAGSRNSLIGNHISIVEDSNSSQGDKGSPVAIRITSGEGNFVSNNHIISRAIELNRSADCFESQVSSITKGFSQPVLDFLAVEVDAASSGNYILDSGQIDNVKLDFSSNAFRPTPNVSEYQRSQ